MTNPLWSHDMELKSHHADASFHTTTYSIRYILSELGLELLIISKVGILITRVITTSSQTLTSSMIGSMTG
ncbi:MAG: hypothetical protein ACFFER_02045 [Candidatus Thorarchaeota archaeon]